MGLIPGHLFLEGFIIVNREGQNRNG